MRWLILILSLLYYLPSRDGRAEGQKKRDAYFAMGLDIIEH